MGATHNVIDYLLPKQPLPLLFLLITLSAAPAIAGPADPAAGEPARTTATADALPIEATPAWVIDRRLPEPSKATLDVAPNGIADLLVDSQYRTRADGHDERFRWAGKVTNRSGLEAAGQISFSFRTGMDTAAVNYIHIIRDGQIIDVTRDTKFRVVEREEDLNDGIISGTVKALANIQGLRVGDIVDFGAIVHTRNTLWPGAAFYTFSQRYSDPLAMRGIRILWPAGMAPRYKPINSDLSFATRAVADGTEWEWIATNPPALKPETDVPYTAFQWGRIDVTTMKDWAELARRTNELYQGDDSLPADFTARLDAIAKAWPAPADRLTEVTRYIEDNIRYVGEELDEGSFVPRRPRTVLSRAYGDCKDKSLLLSVALRYLGIDAVPALVSTTSGARLPDRLPSPLLFDHMIVRAVLDGKVLWLDPTGAHRGGRGLTIVPSDLGYALPVRAGQTALEKMDGFGARAGRITVQEQFDVDEAAAQAMTLHVESVFTDARADRMRARIAEAAPKVVADDNLKFYLKRFPGMVESKPLQLIDDRDANKLTMIENYTLSQAAFKKANLSTDLVMSAYVVREVLPERQPGPRREPLAMPSFTVNEQIITLRAKGRSLQGLTDIDTRAGPVAFSRKFTRTADGLVMTFRLDTGTRDDVPASEADQIYALSDTIDGKTGIVYHLAKSAPPAPDPKGIDAAALAPIKADILAATELMQKNDQQSKLQALTLLTGMDDRLVRPSPTAGLIDGMKAALLADLGRQQAALAAFRSSTAQYEGNAEFFRLWLAYEIDLGTGETVAAAMQRTATAQPEVLAKLDPRWVEVSLQRTQSLPSDQRTAARGNICIALDSVGWQQTPRTSRGDGILECAITAHARRGEFAEARAGLAKTPNTGALVSIAIDKRYQPLWPDVERFTRDGFRASLQESADRAATAAKANPTSYPAVQKRMESLRALGDFEAALAAGKALASNKAGIEVAESDGFWLVNEYAINQTALGRMDDAIATMDGLLALGQDRYPELTSLAINRAEILLAAGRFQQALDSLGAIEAKHLGNLSPYGKMWVLSDQVCALHGLGRDAEARTVAARLAKPEDNWNAATAAAACLNDDKAIADMLIKRLGDSFARRGVLEMFITFERSEGRTPFEESRTQVITRARQRPEVQAEFAKHGRTVRYDGTRQGWNEF